MSNSVQQKSERVLGGARLQCVLIVLPDWLDIVWWREQCENADPLATMLVKGRVAVPGIRIRTLYTYPELRLPPVMGDILRNTPRVYVGWKGRVRWWHQALDVAPVSAKDMLGMHLMWQSRMRVGELYRWVGAVPFPVPEEWPVPEIPRAWPLSFIPGELAPQSDGEAVPDWFHKGVY